MNRPLLILSGREIPDTLSAMEQAVVDRCRDHGLDCWLVPHLYHLSESSDWWDALAARVGHGVLLCWLHPRPAAWILRRHRIPEEGLSIVDLGGFSDADAAFAAVLGSVQEPVARERAEGSTGRASGTQPRGRMETFQEPVGRRWYPVVDGSRCVHCQHCLQFCLFGVYELDAEGKVVVGHPDRCKTGCPACSRVCPQSAIMFPLYEKDAAIAGAPGQFVIPDVGAQGVRGSLPNRLSAGHVAGANGSGTGWQAAGGAGTPGRPPFDDLDELVEQLDQRMQRRL